MTILGFINKYICQWMFCRIYKTLNDKKQIMEWGIIIGIKPLSGYKTDYKTFFSKSKIPIWKKNVTSINY